MTQARYLEDSTAREFDATVSRVVDDRVVLDSTLFYPKGGGQPRDEGVFQFDETETRVIDVQKKDTIYHTVEGQVPEPGTTVHGVLDWDRRYAHMRYHTAQHLLSAVLLDEFGARTTGNQLYADRARIDCEEERFDESDLSAIESQVNDYIQDDRQVSWETWDRDTAESELDPDRTRLELLPDSITEVRIVEIDGVDRTACAGTHVETTAEIGDFEISGRETKGTDEERVRFELDL